MYKNLAKLAKELESPYVNIELELRFKILKPITFKYDTEKNIKYYRSSIYPNITFRSYKEYYIESKEIVEKIKTKDNITIALSIEQEYIKSDLKIPLIEVNKRTIYRQKINNDPLTEIVKCGNEFTLEIEFNINNYNKVDEIIKKWKLPYYPCIKPKEISSINLAKKLRRTDQWCISPKADGLHVLIIENKNKVILVHDNGYVSNINNKKEEEMIKPINIYEGELMNNEKILYFDCLMYDGKNITKKDYIERRKYIKENKNRKEIVLFNSVYSIQYYLYEPIRFKSDGYIITNIKNRNIIYKSKFINTVDLKYKNGYLLLENETYSERIPKTTNYNFEEKKIYEFNMNMELIRERKDKTIANFKFPYDNNPIYKVVTGIGIPSLRCFHNKIKRKLLEILPKTSLLDIGSGKGGDIEKWSNLKFEKIYAVDQNLKLREHSKKIIEIKEKFENIPSFIEYESFSILFVPWDDSFYNALKKAKYGIMGIMDKPIEIETKIFSCKINKKDKKIELKIPATNTAENIIENKTNYKKVFEKIKSEKWYHKKIEFKMDYGTEEEKILASMYSFYYLTNYSI